MAATIEDSSPASSSASSSSGPGRLQIQVPQDPQAQQNLSRTRCAAIGACMATLLAAIILVCCVVPLPWMDSSASDAEGYAISSCEIEQDVRAILSFLLGCAITYLMKYGTTTDPRQAVKSIEISAT
eukprot:CAMPEP_0206492668 /NCGR_PEP_ID=MMETSP0324_2-20121206/46282_1 /ASSEMBLY_ACC=CAM_ASM_000836 /TAXON_ID=2866 /ORGANISM="Crypthecodinium cohnii, Strain Seligo" /LENGTH=126 /DNA_ID=CAMNT_0053975201 /DNA_START=138 /DNA_END=515 /DNA_ORIENTATION=-